METREEREAGLDRWAAERQELDALLKDVVFATSSNAAKLLRFVCEKYFENPEEPTAEYEVAVKALSRRPEFDSQKDSIVRVEAHRVRRRLQEYYQNEGASHGVGIVLPRGPYPPQFAYSAEPPAAPAEAPARNGARRSRAWAVIALAGVGLSAVAFAGLTFTRRNFSRSNQATGQVPAAAVIAAVAPGDAVHILAGRASGEDIDRTGTRWTGDAWYTGGSAATLRYYSLALADDPAMFENCRIGKEFSYDIPLRPGV